MNTWILLSFIIGNATYGGSAQLHSQEFNSLEACQSASVEIRKLNSSLHYQNTLPDDRIKMVCVKK